MNNNEIFIMLYGGIIQEVYSTNPDTKVFIRDRDIDTFSEIEAGNKEVLLTMDKFDLEEVKEQDKIQKIFEEKLKNEKIKMVY